MEFYVFNPFLKTFRQIWEENWYLMIFCVRPINGFLVSPPPSKINGKYSFLKQLLGDPSNG